jgi:hypothetical protein
MLGRLPSLTIVRLWAALLLAAIGVQAAQPVDTALRPSHGSAFSAATYDVALAPQRRGEHAQTAPTPLPPALPQIAPPVPTPAAVLAPQVMPRPDSTGPPTLRILERQPAPRAPPLA